MQSSEKVELGTCKFVRLSTASRDYDTPRSNFYRAFDRDELTRYKRGTTVYLDVAEIEAWITGKIRLAA